MKIQSILLNIYESTFRPARYFGNIGADLLAANALRSLLFLVSFATLALFLTAVMNMEKLRMAGLAVQSLSHGSTQFSRAIPWNRLFLPIVTALNIFISGISRHIATVLFGDARKSFTTATSISGQAAVPWILLLTVYGLWNNFFPVIPEPGKTEPGYIFITGMFLFFAAWIWEGYICMRAFRAQYGQNLGRAALTFIAPVPVFLGSCCGSGIFLYLLNMK